MYCRVRNAPLHLTCRSGFLSDIMIAFTQNYHRLHRKHKMNKNDIKKKNSSKLRENAEKNLKPDTIPLGKLSETEVRELAHELQIHKIELEMQAEELHKSQVLLEESRQKYFNLYDRAPVGYFTLNEKGFILETNLAGAVMLGTERHSLVNKPLPRYIARENADLFYLHLAKVSESGNKETCELKMFKEDQPFYVHLESIAVKNTEGNIIQYLTTITDISGRIEWEKKWVFSLSSG